MYPVLTELFLHTYFPFMSAWRSHSCIIYSNDYWMLFSSCTMYSVMHYKSGKVQETLTSAGMVCCFKMHYEITQWATKAPFLHPQLFFLFLVHNFLCPKLYVTINIHFKTTTIVSFIWSANPYAWHTLLLIMKVPF